MSTARELLGDGVDLQGNLDPLLLLAPKEITIARSHDILREVGGAPGHIFNLGHGITPKTPVDTAKAVVDAVHEFTLT